MQADEAFFKLLRLGIGTCHDRDVALDKDGWAAVYDMLANKPWLPSCWMAWSVYPSSRSLRWMS